MTIARKFITILIVISCMLYSGESKTNQTSATQDEVYLTIFVHGILNIKPHLSFSNLIRFMRDQITDSVYARAVEIMRNDPFFYQFNAMQGLGLHKIETELAQDGYVSGAFALAYDSFSALNTPTPHAENVYYTFGWSGLLSTQVRYQEATLFYEQLEREIQEYKNRGISPKIRVVGYSHGGYIALNLGAVFNDLKLNNPTWFIDELILIGVPVISDTDFLVSSNLFKKIYHFYSPSDRVQVVDCLATNRFFSHRIFSSRYGFLLPDRLTQIQLRCKRIAQTKFAQNGCKHHNNHFPPKLLRNADPGHTELWSFGWSSGYRSYLPYYPFPAGVYLNYIINSLKRFDAVNKHIIVDIRPFQNSMIISNINSSKKRVVPFPSKDEHNQIALQIKPYMPKNCSKYMYEEKAEQALVIAHKQKNEEWYKASDNALARKFKTKLSLHTI